MEEASLQFISYTAKNNIFNFFTKKDIIDVANIITDGRFNNYEEVFIYNCPYCGGYGFLNAKYMEYGKDIWLYGEMCLDCEGRGKLTFTEYFLIPSVN